MIADLIRKFHMKKSKGTTLVEMVVSFALLGIFVSASAVVISNVTNLYYRVRGESYARQVGDIVVNKVASEISGAMYDEVNTGLNPYITDDFEEDTNISVDGNVITLYNRSQTGISIFADDGILNVYYHKIEGYKNAEEEKNRQAVNWNFDKKMYNGYAIKSLEFVPANSTENDTLAAAYGITDVNHADYPANVVAVYMRLESDRYGSFNICRFVKIYDAPENMKWAGTTNP